MSCHFKPLDGFETWLSATACGREKALSLAADISEYLPEYGDWTTILLCDGNAREVVKVENRCGHIIYERGFAGTRVLSFPCGTDASFHMTKAGVEATACCEKWFEDCELGV